MKLCKRIVAAVVMTAMLAVCIPAMAFDLPSYPEAPEGYDGYVTFAVSALTLGWNYIIDPVLIPIHEGETFDVVTERAFEMLEWEHDSQVNEYGYNLSGVACYETEPMVPAYLMNEILAYPEWAEDNLQYVPGEWTGAFTDDEMLSAFEYCTLSGWMYTENNVDPGVGATGLTVTAGNVYTWIFTIYGYGMDYGISDGWGMFPTFDNPMAGVDRTEVSEALALISADEELSESVLENAFEEAVMLLGYYYDPEATQAELDDALEALLNAIMPDEPTYEMGDVDLSGEVNVQDALLLLRAAMELVELDDEAIPYADVNGDGNIDLQDALLVLRTAMGLI